MENKLRFSTRHRWLRRSESVFVVIVGGTMGFASTLIFSLLGLAINLANGLIATLWYAFETIRVNWND